MTDKQDRTTIEYIQPKKVEMNRNSRYEVLKHAIQTGYHIPSKEGAIVRGWTPNNIRRIILMPVGVLIQFHRHELTPYAHAILQVPYGKALENDENKAREQGLHTVKPVLDVFKGNMRSMSMLEEIIVCTEGYDPRLLKQDIQPFLQQQNIDTKYIRFSYLTCIQIDTQKLITLYRQHKQFMDSTITDALQGTESLHIVYNNNNEEWWNRTHLRDSKYEQDVKLEKHFEAYKMLMSSHNTYKLTPQEEATLQQELKQSLVYLGMINDMRKSYTEINKLIYKWDQSWAFPSKENEVYLRIHHYLTKDESYAPMRDQIQKLNLNVLSDYIQNKGLDSKGLLIVSHIKELRHAILQADSESDEPYSLKQTIQKLNKVMEFLTEQYAYGGHLLLASIMTEVSVEYSKKMWYTLASTRPYNVKFPKDFVKFVDIEFRDRMKDRNFKEYIDDIGEEGNFTIVDNVPLDIFCQEASRLALSFEGYTHDVPRDLIWKGRW